MPLRLALPRDRREPIDARTLELGFVNNLSDAGLERGDRQIVDLLREVAGPREVRLRFFSLPSIRRGAVAAAHIAARYTPYVELADLHLDGLIVTGSEPTTRRLSDEAFWRQLAALVDWAEHNTRSSIWSCLSAHAAVLHLDGIERRMLPEKRSGLFTVAPVRPHPLLGGAPCDLRIPHSRWNDLDADELAAAGYEILTRGESVGVDTFVKQWRSLFVYLQGHPEYDPAALGREYRRDVLRFLEGTRADYPSLPRDYFDPETERELGRIAAAAHARRDTALATALPLTRRGAWPHGLARTLFGNWLTYLDARAVDHAA